MPLYTLHEATGRTPPWPYLGLWTCKSGRLFLGQPKLGRRPRRFAQIRLEGHGVKTRRNHRGPIWVCGHCFLAQRCFLCAVQLH